MFREVISENSNIYVSFEQDYFEIIPNLLTRLSVMNTKKILTAEYLSKYSPYRVLGFSIL